MSSPDLLSVVIPTYGRGRILVDTILLLRGLETPPAEIIIADQTPRHEAAIEDELGEMDRAGAIRWLRLPRPSIPGAMNQGLLAARHRIVLFLDDDIAPLGPLVAAHLQAYADPSVQVIAGRVIQPWDDLHDGSDVGRDGSFRYASTRRQRVEDFIGCNFSVRRETALAVGGFDENFVHVAHWFEKEFADRLKRAGVRPLFEPDAAVRHLKAVEGGVRSYGTWRKTVRPSYSVGSYYYLMTSTRIRHRLATVLLRPFRVISTRLHLRNPWWIPPTLMGEFLGFFWALLLAAKGPRLVGGAPRKGEP